MEDPGQVIGQADAEATDDDHAPMPFAAYLRAEPIWHVADGPLVDGLDAATIIALHRLPFLQDYRAALQDWFGRLCPGGHLFVTVPGSGRPACPPHADVAGAFRSYTAARLLDEIEEALDPDTYRIRWLGEPDDEASGNPDIALVVQKVVMVLDVPSIALNGEPDFTFEPAHTRIEIGRTVDVMTILVYKLDHLGDFIMGVPALHRLRAAFPDARITGVVGSWNHFMAIDLGVFDTVVSADVFPAVQGDVASRAETFAAAATGNFDLAIDLRTDFDTRFLLNHVRAGLRAGLGTHARFPYLDIFLPTDDTRHDREFARVDDIPPADFATSDRLIRTAYRISGSAAMLERNDDAVIWGPYRSLHPGRYLFFPRLDIDREPVGLLGYDIAIDRRVVAKGLLPCKPTDPIPFTVDTDNSGFEFRIQRVTDAQMPTFHFYGGRLVHEGVASVLHQSEYLVLLIELVALRVNRLGILRHGDFNA